jgi:hypothetical protein
LAEKKSGFKILILRTDNGGVLDHVVIDANGLIICDIVGSYVIDANGLV